MTSTPPNEPAAVSTPPESPAKNELNNNNNGGEGPQPTANGEGYHGYDPVSGLYYYMDNTNPIMYYNGYTGAWLYWSEEGQYYYPAVVPPPAASAATEGAEGTSEKTAADAAAASSNTNNNNGKSDQKDQPAVKKVPDEDKHPLPFRLTSAVQSERNRVLPAQTKTKGLRMDWADALDNYEFRGFGGRAGGLGHFSNPPILQPRFYYPHQVPGSYYDFLNCRPDASVEEIVNSVQWWQLVGYPKALEADGERAERINRLILEAAVIISNPTLRAQYDQTLPIMSDHDGKKHAKRSSSSTLAVDPNFVPRVLHFHQDDMANSNAAGSRSSSRPTSVSSTPSKYGAVGTPGDENNLNQNRLTNTLEDEVSQPNLAERLFAAVSEGIFGPPRTRPKSKKYALRGQEWVDDERRKMMEDDETNEGGNAVSTSSAFKVTNTSTNKDISSGVKIQQHVDPSGSQNNQQQAVKPPL